VAASKGYEILGVQEIDGRLETFVRVALPAECRIGTRAAAKIVHEEFKVRVAVKSGAFRDASAVRAIKRSRKKIGHKVTIIRERLFRLYTARTGKPPGKRKVDDEPMFYVIVNEFGDEKHEPESPLRSSLYDNERAVKVECSQAILRAINHPKVKAKK